MSTDEAKEQFRFYHLRPSWCPLCLLDNSAKNLGSFLCCIISHSTA